MGKAKGKGTARTRSRSRSTTPRSRPRSRSRAQSQSERIRRLPRVVIVRPKIVARGSRSGSQSSPSSISSLPTAKITKILLHSLSRKALADKLQLHPSFITHILAGARGVSIPVMYKWAELLGMSFDRLYRMLEVLRGARKARITAILLEAENRSLEQDPRVLINGFRDPYASDHDHDHDHDPVRAPVPPPRDR